MKKQIIFLIISLLVLSLVFFIKPYFSGNLTLDNEKIKLGYCPTMQKEAINLAEKNNYELVMFDSASQTLLALKNNQINKALIGRKANSDEINKNIKETILESGYTLVSDNKRFIEYSELDSIEIYTNLSKEITNELVPFSKINFIQKNKIKDKINEGNIVLIAWKDWRDDFELVVVMDNGKKARDFRGVFFYEY